MKTHHTPSRHDFDFFHGSWRIAHRQLKERLAGCHEWIEFSGTCTTQPMLAGAANVDDNVIEHPAGAYRAITLRSFDAVTKMWSIWWLDGRFPARIDTPVVGRFDDGEGVFYADDTFNGRAIKVRFMWDVHPVTPRWEQAFSADGGESWETNWIMEFSRTV